MTITHCERFAPVTTSGTAFEVRTFAVNPGLNGVFPWLSDVANRYEKYKFRRLTFRYRPQSSTAAGNVTLAFDFDPNDDAPATMSEATTYHDYVNSPIWAPANLTVDLVNGDKLPQKNTRPGLPGADIDLNVYDVGQIHVLTEGAAAATIGYVEVEYVCDLFIHQIQNTVGGYCSATADLDATHLIGSDTVVDAQSYIPVTQTSTSVMTFKQPFEGLVSVVVMGTVLSANYAPVTSADGTATIISAGQLVNGAATMVQAVFRVRAITGTTWTPTITATTVAAVQYRFARGAYTSFGS
jgi:hypothetical protein